MRDEIMDSGEQTLVVDLKGPAIPLDDLLEKAKSGDIQSFEELMVRHERIVFKTALRILGNVEDAQDAAQEVFLRLFTYIKSVHPSRPLAPWLYKVTINACRDIFRKRPQTLPLIDSEELAAPKADVDRSSHRKIMEMGLRMLSEKERSAIVLRDLQGLSTSEVAQILGSSETTVRSQISRARIKLKEFRSRMLRRQL